MRLSPHVTHSGRQTHRSDRGSHLPLDELLLGLGDGLGGVEALRAGVGAIQDGVAAVEPERVLKVVEPLAACLVAAVYDPALRLQQDSRPEEALAGPPITGTAGAAAGAENAFVESVDLGAVRRRLLPFLFRRRRDGLKPRLDRGVLGVEVAEIGNEILDYRQVWQGIDPDHAHDLVRRHGARERVGAVDVHGARAADALTAGAPEGERRIDDVLDPDQRVQHHWRAIVEIDEVGVHARVVRVVGIPAIDAELAWVPRAGRARPRLTYGDLRVLGKRELDHQLCPLTECQPLDTRD